MNFLNLEYFLAVAKSLSITQAAGELNVSQQALSKLEREHFRREEAQTDLLDELCNADLLVLDDLGAEFSTSFTVSVIYNIINTRIIDGLPTIISTNLTLEEIEAKYSQRVSSRLLGNFKMIRFIGNDIRMEKLR